MKTIKTTAEDIWQEMQDAMQKLRTGSAPAVLELSDEQIAALRAASNADDYLSERDGQLYFLLTKVIPPQPIPPELEAQETTDRVSGFREVERKGICLHSSERSGDVTFGVYLSYDCDYDDEELIDALRGIGEGDNTVAVSLPFSISDCVDDLFDGYIHTPSGTFSGGMRKPIASLRAELEAAIERLDAAKFREDDGESDALVVKSSGRAKWEDYHRSRHEVLP